MNDTAATPQGNNDVTGANNTGANDANATRQYDIVLYGATSFVGQLVAEYLNQFLANDELADNTTTSDAKKSYAKQDITSDAKQAVTWAIAGRDKDKLNKLKQQLGNAELAIIIANSNEQDTLDDMAARARVIISSVGPYTLYGEPLIKACVNHGTDYVDLTGETLFIKDMLDKYSAQAKHSGARIVHSCGFDSIPSDLGVYFTQMSSYAQYERYCDTIHMRVKAAKGGLSGGTIASMGTIFTKVAEDKTLRKQLANPYLLNTDANPPSVRQTTHKLPKTEGEDEKWIAPFVMESINSRIVHRSNQLMDYLYGRDFNYDEAMLMPSGIKGRLMSYGMTAGIAGFAAAMSFEPSRDLLNKHILPKSGSGPAKHERENGYFDIRFQGLIDNTTQIKTKVTGDKDPGYGGTSRMLSQAALCLLQDTDDIEGGFWTPASAMGDKLIARLEQYAGISFEVLYLEDKQGALQ